MAITVSFYQFNKDGNSTKAPPDTATKTDVQMTLKEGSSVLNPVLLLSFTGSSPIVWNYAYILDFTRFYFVENWENVRGNLWQASLRVDVLASYRASIINQEQYIERAAAKANNNLFDPLALGTRTVSTNRGDTDSPWRGGRLDYVVEVLGSGSSQFFVMPESFYTAFIQALFSDAYVDSVFPGWADTYPEIKAMLNPLQYIGSVRAFPVNLATGGTVSGIWVGYGFVSVAAYVALVDGVSSAQYQLTFPSHPQASGAPWLKNSPYSEYELYFPPFGTFPIDAGIVSNDPVIRCVMKIDIPTGQGRLDLFAGSPEVLVGSATAQIGVDVKVSETYVNNIGTANMLATGASIVTSVLTGGITGGVNSTAATVDNLLGNFTPKMRAVGSNSGWAGFSGEIAAMGRFQRVVFPDYTHAGYPLNEKNTPLAVGEGYIKTIGAHLELPFAYRSEVEEAENLMNGGFYYE